MTLPQLSSARLPDYCPECKHGPLALHQATLKEKLAASLAHLLGRKT
jgi:hypothetical protein